MEENVTSLVKPIMNLNAKGYMIESVVYNGDIMSKIDVMIYLRDTIALKKEIDKCMQNVEVRDERLRILEIERKRRTITMPPPMQKPTGFAALFSANQRAYEKWLSEAPEREKERLRLEEEEEQRVTKLKKEYSSLQDENFAELGYAHKLVKQYTEQMQRQIIAPNYRDVHILETLLLYLFNNRAQTLTDAINLYHEEQHRLTMQNLAEQQRRQIEIAREEQMRLAWQQMESQREQLQQIAKSAKEAEEAAKQAKYYAELDFLMNLEK